MCNNCGKGSEFSSRITGNQLEVMMRYVEDHPDFANGKLSDPSGRATLLKMWEDLAILLNAVGNGPSKPALKWQKTWVDWKSNTKKKFVKARQHQSGTGGGPPSHITLSSVEERLIAFLAPAVEGDTTPEAGLPAPEIILQEIMLEDVAVDLQLEEVCTIEEPEILPGPSAAKKRKGEILMLSFVNVEEKRFQLEERRWQYLSLLLHPCVK